jgi:hypothetical protein
MRAAGGDLVETGPEEPRLAEREVLPALAPQMRWS